MAIIETIVGGAIGGITGLGGVFLGNWLSSKRSDREKIVSLRRESYGRILSDLWEIERLCDAAAESISERGELEYFHSKQSSDVDDKIFEFITAIRKRFTDDYLIISDEFRSLYEAMNSESASDPNDLPPEAHEHFDKMIRRHRPILLARARSEVFVN